MSLASRRGGTQFHKPKNVAAAGKTLKPREWAYLMYFAGFPKDIQTVAEGLGVLEAESGFNSDPGGDGAHFGAWQEDSSFGSVEDRLDPWKSTLAAAKAFKVTGSFRDKWGQWEEQQGGVDGSAQWRKWKKEAEIGLVEAATMKPTGGGPADLLSAGVNAAGDVVDTAMSATDFLVEMAETFTNFKKLGQLAAEGLAWMLRLVIKATWYYVVAPVVHWSERAVQWYWVNFFTTGTEKGSGKGNAIRQSAGIVTIAFWAIGYAVLWSDGQSVGPAPARASMLGQGVRAVDGAIARRNLIKPKHVKEKTPAKPKPAATAVSIEKTGEFATNRKRPVSVSSDGKNLNREGNKNERDNGRQTHAIPKPRTPGSPETQKGRQESGTEEGSEGTAKAPVQAPGSDKPGVDTRGDSGGKPKGTPSPSGEKRGKS